MEENKYSKISNVGPDTSVLLTEFSLISVSIYPLNLKGIPSNTNALVTFQII